MRETRSGFYTYLRLLSYLKQYWLRFLFGVIATAAASAIAAWFTWFLKPLLNKGFIDPNISFIKWLPLIVIAAYAALSAAAFAGDYFVAWVARHVIMQLQRSVFKKYLKLPATYFHKHSSGQLIAKLIYNVEQVAEASTSAVLTIIKDIFYIGGLLIVMFTNSVLLTLIFLAAVPFIAIIVTIAGKIMKRLSLQVQDAVADISHITEETIEGGEVVASYGGHQHESERFYQATGQVCRKRIHIVIANSIGSSASRVITSAAVASSIFVATSPAHALSAGAFISSIAAMLSIFKPLRNLTNINDQLQKGIAGAESLFEVLDHNDAEDFGEICLPEVKGNIEYRNLSFAYPDSHKEVLKDVSFKLPAGKTLAIVGHSGSGKTSLVNLLPRFYDVTIGSIYIDGVDIKQIALSSLRAQFSMVSQHITLFNDTVAKNIAYSCLGEIDQKQLQQAAEAAHALDFINDLPHGFDTIIGENGVLLSGGERQRIAIARAILRNAPILILDEATSVLDTISERHIQQALVNLMKHRTTIVIAHRLSTIKNSDTILVLNAGRIVETGSHQELLNHAGFYSKLYSHGKIQH